jgi:hypothetical protein
MTQRSEIARTLWPHLPRPKDDQPLPKPTSPLAASMYPRLAPPKPKPSNPYRDILLKNLKEINARHRKGVT